jgi:protein AaeX
VRFAEVNLFGVYVAPVSVMMLAAWLVLTALRRTANHFGVLRRVWRQTLFVLTVHTIVLSSLVLIVAHEAN